MFWNLPLTIDKRKTGTVTTETKDRDGGGGVDGPGTSCSDAHHRVRYGSGYREDGLDWA